ncbi:MAG: class I SAM-dependent methyltransferase [Moorea sp. SIO2B7]|nr:class I SAM-dependent methyltransferase [Moorena sp. SIO2B7]
MNPVSNTAYYCCGIRMEDAKRDNSVCNDIYAQRFMDERGMQIFEPFKSEKMANIGSITRCRLIDDYLKAELANNSDLNVISIGAGFDTRPYRLTGGNWLEIDEPQIITYKNEKLPVDECSNPLRRISIDFAHESLADKLKKEDKDRHTIFVIEGVFMYLDSEAINKTVKALQEHFPKHALYCDLMTSQFFYKFTQNVHKKLVAAGGKFSKLPDEPEEIFTNHHYTLVERTPMFKRAGELGLLWSAVKIPTFISWLMLNVLLKELSGYAVHRFDFNKMSGEVPT